MHHNSYKYNPRVRVRLRVSAANKLRKPEAEKLRRSDNNKIPAHNLLTSQLLNHYT